MLNHESVFEIKHFAHRFRNALSYAIEFNSHSLFQLDGWNELSGFPSGSCTISSKLLGQYLQRKGFAPQLIQCGNDLPQYRDVKSHAWLEVDDYYIDITINQFNSYVTDRVYVVKKSSPTMLADIRKNSEEVTSVVFFNIEPISASYGELYRIVETMADALK